MASSLNKAMIIGNLTRDPESKMTPSGQNVCSFGVATNRTWKNAAGEKQEAVDYHNVVVWGKLAEICAQYLNKGKKVYIEGRLQSREWEGPDGAKRNKTEIVAENMVMLSGPQQGGGSGAPFNRTSAMPKMADEPSASPDDEIKLEDIPF
jgi:single-strand DNA-binding protein